MRLRFVLLASLLAIPAAAAVVMRTPTTEPACTPGTLRLDLNGNPQICLKR